MAKKADAYGEYKNAAKVSKKNKNKKTQETPVYLMCQIAMWMEALPGLAAEVSAPISQTNSIK